MGNSYLQFHIELLKQTHNQLLTYPPFKDAENPDDEAFLDALVTVITLTENQEADYLSHGQDLLTQWIRRYPDTAPLIPRDLFWFYGGDCLHFMPDEEINLFQQLDEARWEAEQTNEPYDYAPMRARILGLTDLH